MFGFVKQIFVTAMMFFGCSLPSASLLKCIAVTNQECKVRPKVVNINSNEPAFYLLALKQVNAVVVVTISMIHLQKFVFLIL